MSDQIDRAAEIIYVEVFGLPDYNPDAVDDHNRHSYRGDCECNASDRVDARHAAEALDAAGLLASPTYAAEVREAARAEALAGFKWEESGEVGPCVNPDHATAHVAPGAKWSGPTCQHYVEVARRRLVGPPERIPEDES